MPNNKTPVESLQNLFPEIVYDENQVPNLTLDIWNAYRVKVIPSKFNKKAFFNYRIKDGDTLENIAERFYGSNRFWWVTPLINDVEDPFDMIQNFQSDRGIQNLGTIKILKLEYIGNIKSNMLYYKQLLTDREEKDRKRIKRKQNGQ